MTAALASCDIAQDMLLSRLEIERLRAARQRVQQLVGRGGHATVQCGRAQMRDDDFLRTVRAYA